ncbi:MAG TPA: hypothetical protein VFW42_08285, partial [Fluviicoccus sp.]|nr:hypothetical protein [Fluviicoccus sp.]
MKKILAGILLFTSLPLTAQAARDDLDELRDNGVNKNEGRLSKHDKMRDIKVYVKNDEGKNIRSFKVEAMFNYPVEDLAR